MGTPSPALDFQNPVPRPAAQRVAQRQTVDPLRQHLGKLILDALRIASVGKATHHTSQQPDLAIRPAQQRRPALSGQQFAGKLRHHPPRKMYFKLELRLATLCH
jgi:hypothetical protein